MVHDYNKNFVLDTKKHKLILNWSKIDEEMLFKFFDSFVEAYRRYTWKSQNVINLDSVVNDDLKNWQFPWINEKNELLGYFSNSDFKVILWSILTEVFKVRERKNSMLFSDRCSAIFIDFLASLEEFSKWGNVNEEIFKIISELRNDNDNFAKTALSFEAELAKILDSSIPETNTTKKPQENIIVQKTEEIDKNDLLKWIVSREVVNWYYEYFGTFWNNTFPLELIKENSLAIFKDQENNYYFKLQGWSTLYKLDKNIKSMSWENNTLKLIFKNWDIKIINL